MKANQFRFYLVTLVAMTLVPAGAAESDAGENTARVREALVQTLPALACDHLQAKLVEVTYPPGAASSPHRHSSPVIVYVLSGAVRSRVGDQPERIYHAGEVFYEAPNQLHAVSANASETKSASFLACF